MLISSRALEIDGGTKQHRVEPAQLDHENTSVALAAVIAVRKNSVKAPRAYGNNRLKRLKKYMKI